jgi:Histidine-specific methyltransferase, SAM-dependent
MTALHVERCLPEGYLDRALREDARAGLSASPKTLPPKWLYDEQGSELFEKITRLEEYYPTRAERSILAAVAGEIAAATRASTLVELGAGAADKTRLLLDALRAAGTLRSFVPVDVSEATLVEAAHRVLASYPGLSVRAVVSDFEEHLGLPGSPGARLVAFLGGTIGNLEPGPRTASLGCRCRSRPAAEGQPRSTRCARLAGGSYGSGQKSVIRAISPSSPRSKKVSPGSMPLAPENRTQLAACRPCPIARSTAICHSPGKPSAQKRTYASRPLTRSRVCGTW